MGNGILTSAISGLNVNAQRVAASADNIANSSTPDYKRVEIQAKTLSVQQTSTTQYSAGGVLATVRTSTDLGPGFGAFNNSVDFGTEFASLITAENAYNAGVKVVQVGAEMAQNLMDVKA